MSVFWNNFIGLCNERGEKPSIVCRKIAIAPSAPTAWKRGAMPNEQSIQKIADYFGVTPNYLCHANADMTTVPAPRKAVFWENYLELCNEREIKPTTAVRDMGISPGAPTSWKLGAVPRIAVAQKVADYFGVTVERLYHGKAETAADTHKDEIFREIVSTVESLDEDKQKQLLDYVRFLNSQG